MKSELLDFPEAENSRLRVNRVELSVDTLVLWDVLDIKGGCPNSVG
jgi:hypothetical protein